VFSFLLTEADSDDSAQSGVGLDGIPNVGVEDRYIDILFSTITNNNYFKNIVTQWKATRGNTPSKLVA